MLTKPSREELMKKAKNELKNWISKLNFKPEQSDQISNILEDLGITNIQDLNELEESDIKSLDLPPVPKNRLWKSIPKDSMNDESATNFNNEMQNINSIYELFDNLMKSKGTILNADSPISNLKDKLIELQFKESIDQILTALEKLGVNSIQDLNDLEESDIKTLNLSLISKRKLWKFIKMYSNDEYQQILNKIKVYSKYFLNLLIKF